MSAILCVCASYPQTTAGLGCRARVGSVRPSSPRLALLLLSNDIVRACAQSNDVVCLSNPTISCVCLIQRHRVCVSNPTMSCACLIQRYRVCVCVTAPRVDIRCRVFVHMQVQIGRSVMQSPLQVRDTHEGEWSHEPYRRGMQCHIIALTNARHP